MKNKKILIIVVIVVILCAIVVGGINFYSTHLFNKDGTISNPSEEVIEHLKSIENADERKTQINHALNNNMITQEQANELY